MKQVVTRKGNIEVIDVPAPQLVPGAVLVEVRASCISAGTEAAGIGSSGMGMLERAIKEPQRALNIAELAIRQGVLRTFDNVRAALDSAVPLGYSAAGLVEAVGPGVERFSPGDRVACAGAGQANHAERIVVADNLVAPVPDGVGFRQASTVALGAIAMQGVRRAEPTLGEWFVVIGLGLLGQLTVQLLRATGARVIGVEPDPDRRQLATAAGADKVLAPDDPTLIDTVRRVSGHGADGAIITAAGSSSEIVSTAFQVCRPKGRVVLVGDVGLQLKREDLYVKELDFRMATSYGPGRYDARYEEKGLDYPIGYVRWTEGRNMEEYLKLLAEGRISLEALTHDSWPVDRAPEAYAALEVTPKAPLLFLDYPAGQETSRDRVTLTAVRHSTEAVGFAVVGAGSFARSVHLPNLRSAKGAELVAVVSRDGLNARDTAEHFRAPVATTSLEEALAVPDVAAVLIATRHDLHVDQTLAALEAGKHVLVEKPLALTADGLERIRSFFNGVEEEDAPILVTGFNRRFSPFTQRLKEALAQREGPLMASYRMNAGYLPPDHWVHGPEGGGRNLGEACHIYDLFISLVDEEVVDISALATSAPGGHDVPRDNFTVALRFRDGSVCSLIYTAVGHSGLPKERLEVFWDGRAAVLDDYRSVEFHGGARALSRRRQEKGHAEELDRFVQAIRKGGPWPIPLWQQVEATRVALEVERRLTGSQLSERAV